MSTIQPSSYMNEATGVSLNYEAGNKASTKAMNSPFDMNAPKGPKVYGGKPGDDNRGSLDAKVAQDTTDKDHQDQAMNRLVDKLTETALGHENYEKSNKGKGPSRPSELTFGDIYHPGVSDGQLTNTGGFHHMPDDMNLQRALNNNTNQRLPPRQTPVWTTNTKPVLATQLSALAMTAPPEGQYGAPDFFGGPRAAWANANRRATSFQPVPTGPSMAVGPGMYNRRPSLNTSASFNSGRTSYDYSMQNHLASPMASSYNPSPMATPLSPTAADFTSASNSTGMWTGTSSEPSVSQQTYLSTIDKIVCNNDQQASIFLQQKLKIGTPDQKHAIIDAIVSQAYPLMTNRFGNFLVQRCFEHGTPEQVEGITNAIRGNTLNLSMDAFGCHVIQKALDCVNEEFKTVMVSELLRRIPETVVHRYACHVWQKLFELRWIGSPPLIMKYVNEALRGRWPEVALGETGSLVVQNIFENCLEEDKRPCINEVLANIDIIAHGQFGNWCIQHICEHGSPADRSRAIDVVIHNAADYSMDQYASKVVEKCLKIGGTEFLDRYLDRVCEGRPDRPRIPLIDIASDQYGNYLVQWILQHATPNHREQVASHIRKHMVSLRGSKFGSRVGMLCCQPMYTNRMIPPTHPSGGMAQGRFNRYGYR